LAKPRAVLILGGGLAGLACADRLAAAGVAVTVLEKLPDVGGLARSIRFAGATFDLGGHRFFTEKPALLAWLRGVVGDGLREVERRSRILLRGRFFDYPLRPFNALSNFGARDSARIVADYLRCAVRRRRRAPRESSFEEWIVNRFGPLLFETYFRPYTEKTWGLPCAEISAEWASERIQLLNLADAVWRTLPLVPRPKTYATKFWYPTGGIGVVGERLAARLAAHGGTIVGDATVESLRVRDGRVAGVVANGRAYEADAVISTLPLTALCRMLGAPDEATLSRLSYRAIRCVCLVIDGARVTDDTWLYFSEAGVVFGRSHEPGNWDPTLAPPSGTSLCLEVFCNEGDDLWRRDEAELVDACVRDLRRLGLLRHGGEIQGRCVNVPHAYPVFRVGYRDAPRAALVAVAAVGNLHVVGRTGAYRYENMDQVAEAAIALADRLVSA